MFCDFSGQAGIELAGLEGHIRGCRGGVEGPEVAVFIAVGLSLAAQYQSVLTIFYDSSFLSLVPRYTLSISWHTKTMMHADTRSSVFSDI